MRKSFVDRLTTGEPSISAEYASLHELIFRRYGFYGYVEPHFEEVGFRSTCVSLRDFNERNEYDFERQKASNNEEALLDFCEYAFNFTMALISRYDERGKELCQEIVRHIRLVADKMGRECLECDGLFKYIPRDHDIRVAAAIAPESIAPDLVPYD